jgi:hypothetical protein
MEASSRRGDDTATRRQAEKRKMEASSRRGADTTTRRQAERREMKAFSRKGDDDQGTKHRATKKHNKEKDGARIEDLNQTIGCTVSSQAKSSNAVGRMNLSTKKLTGFWSYMPDMQPIKEMVPMAIEKM